DCRFHKSGICSRRDQVREALEHLAIAEALLRQAGPPRRLLVTQSEKALALGRLGQCKQALEQLRLLLPAMDPTLAISVRSEAALCALMLGQHAEARTAAQTTMNSLDNVDVSDREWWKNGYRAGACLRQLGTYQEALALFQRANERAGARSPFAPMI